MADPSARASSGQLGPQDMDTARRLCGNVRLRMLSDDKTFSLSTFNLGRCVVSRVKAAPISLLSPGITRGKDPDYIKLGFVSGPARFHQADVVQMLAPGSCVIYDPTRPYVFTHVKVADQIVVHIPRNMLPAHLGAMLRSPRTFHRNVNSLSVILQSLLDTTCAEIELLDEVSRARLSSTIVQLAVDLMETRMSTLGVEPGGLDVLLHRIKAYISANLDCPTLSITDVARKMGCSERYVYRAFEVEEMTPGEYIRNCRLDLARRKLSVSTDKTSLSELAFLSGFACYAHFSRAFKARFGTAPRYWRAEGGVEPPPSWRAGASAN